MSNLLARLQPSITFGRTPLRHSQNFLPTALAGAVGLALSVVAALLASRWETRNADQEFRAIAENHYLVLQNGLNEYLKKLLTLRALFESSDDRVTRREFEAFARPHLDGDSSIQTLSWVPRVGGDQRAAFELEAARDGLEGYQIKSVKADGSMVTSETQDEYYPIFYSTVQKTSQLYGRDLRTVPSTHFTLDRARDDDKLGVSMVSALVSSNGGEQGYTFSLPVYQPGVLHETVEDRRRNLVGFVHGSFVTSRMIDGALSETTVPQGLDLLFFEPKKGLLEAPLYVHVSRLRSAAIDSKSFPAIGAEPRWSRDILADGSPWLTLVAVPMPGGPLMAKHDRAWIILIAGLSISGVIMLYLWTLGRYVLRSEILALTDPLTALANRRAFLDRLTEAFATRRHDEIPFTVLFLDLDDFKDVNDTLGHAIGDGLLRELAERLKKSVRPIDCVARFGGDEFAILQVDAIDSAAAGSLAARLEASLSEPFTIEGHEVRVTASIGLSRYSADVKGPEFMMMQADLALYRAKNDGRNCFRSHTPELDQQVHLRVTLAEGLRLAIEGGELELYYQPLVEMVSGKIFGVEALVRWNHPSRGRILPSVFIPIAERTGTIVPLGQWVFDEACRQFNQWREQGIAPEVLAVNISGVQFKNTSDLEVSIAATLAKWGINSGDIEIELTETSLMDLKQNDVGVLDRLRQLGVGVAIDDFGTGYSSLNYLTIYPVHRLKIAQELVSKVTSDSRNATVVRASIRLAQELGIEVIAEGVETEAQAEFLVSAGCAYAQGYYFGRPVPAKRATELLRHAKINLKRALIPRLGATAA